MFAKIGRGMFPLPISMIRIWDVEYGEKTRIPAKKKIAIAKF